MKVGIIVCALVLVACSEVFCHGPVLLTGNCRLDELPVKIQADCRSVNCQKDRFGSMKWSSNLCPWSRCGPGQVTRKGPVDLTKTYPDCCPRYTCH